MNDLDLAVKCRRHSADNRRRIRTLRRNAGVPVDIYDSSEPDPADDPSTAGRPYIGILFDCCGVYARVYRRADRPIYRGRCPKCLRAVRVRVGKDGVTTRLFRAS